MNAFDIPIWQLTPRQFFELQEEYAKRSCQQQEPMQQKPEKEWLRLDELAEVLDRKKTSLYRYIPEWEKIGAISKVAGVILVNIKKLRTTKQYINNRTKRQII